MSAGRESMAVKQVLQARMEKHIKEMVTTNPMIGQLNTQFTSWLLGSGLTGTEIIQMIDTNMDAVIQPTDCLLYTSDAADD